MIEYRFLPPAEQEMTSAALFYDTACPGLGADFLDEMNRAISLIRRYPKVGLAVDDNLRQLELRAFQFGIIYVAEDQCILVGAIAHQSRQPFYWKRRLDF